MESGIEIAVDAKNLLGEAVTWSVHDRMVYWVDIESAQLWTFAPSTGKSGVVPLAEAVCSFAFRNDGSLLAARATGLSFLDIASGSERPICNLAPGEQDRLRLNDGRCDRQGRFVVTGLDKSGLNRAQMFSTDESLSPRTLLSGIGVGNSTCFSIDGTKMYFADSPLKVIWEFDYDPDYGTPHDRRVFSDLHDQPGTPDGSVIDAEGYLWNAQWNGSRVVRYDPNGRIDRVVELPCRLPTCVAFGGDDLSTLYVTSARREPSAFGDGDGSLYALSTNVHGLAEPLFRA